MNITTILFCMLRLDFLGVTGSHSRKDLKLKDCENLG